MSYSLTSIQPHFQLSSRTDSPLNSLSPHTYFPTLHPPLSDTSHSLIHLLSPPLNSSDFRSYSRPQHTTQRTPQSKQLTPSATFWNGALLRDNPSTAPQLNTALTTRLFDHLPPCCSAPDNFPSSRSEASALPTSFLHQRPCSLAPLHHHLPICATHTTSQQDCPRRPRHGPQSTLHYSGKHTSLPLTFSF